MSPTRTAEFWKRLDSSQCGAITGIGRWIALFRAVERSDGRAMAGEAEYLMKDGDLGIREIDSYLLVMKIVGLIASGERRPAFMELQKTWVMRSLGERNPLLPGLLMAHAQRR